MLTAWLAGQQLGYMMSSADSGFIKFRIEVEMGEHAVALLVGYLRDAHLVSGGLCSGRACTQRIAH